MIRLSERTPIWLDVLPGVRIQFAPIDMPAWRAAKRAAATALGDAAPDGTGDDDLIEMAGDAFSIAIISRGILAWEGVGDADGNPAATTPENIALLLAEPRYLEACDAVYVMPFALQAREGNASGASPNGTSAQAMPGKAIASSRAKRPRAAAARSARIGKTPRKAKRVKTSGTS